MSNKGPSFEKGVRWGIPRDGLVPKYGGHPSSTEPKGEFKEYPDPLEEEQTQLWRAKLAERERKKNFTLEEAYRATSEAHTRITELYFKLADLSNEFERKLSAEISEAKKEVTRTLSAQPNSVASTKDSFDEISAHCNAIEKWVSELNQNIQARINALQSNVLSLKEPLSAAYNEINRLKNSVEIIDRQEMANKAAIKEIDERLSKVEDYLNNDNGERLELSRIIFTIFTIAIIFLVVIGLAIGSRT